MLQLAWCCCAVSQERMLLTSSFLRDFQIPALTLCGVAGGNAAGTGAFEKRCPVSYVVNLLLLRFGAGFVLLCSEAVSRPV